jgi:hypothetical protein
MKCLTPQLTVQGFPVRTGPGGSYIPKTAQGMQSLVVWRNENTERPDHWLCDEISRGFNKLLLLLRLDGVPAAELIAMTAELWVDTIGYGMNEEQDRERIARGFTLLQGKIKKWPQPVELMQILPTRMKSTSKTTEAPVSDESHARGRAAFDEILEGLK